MTDRDTAIEAVKSEQSNMVDGVLKAAMALPSRTGAAVDLQRKLMREFRDGLDQYPTRDGLLFAVSIRAEQLVRRFADATSIYDLPGLAASLRDELDVKAAKRAAEEEEDEAEQQEQLIEYSNAVGRELSRA